MNNNHFLFFIIGVLSGVLTALSTPLIYGFSFLVFLSLVPLIFILNKSNSIFQIFITSLGYSLGINLLGFFWVATGLNSMWQIPYTQGFLMASPLFLFSEFQVFFVGLIKYFFKNKIKSTFQLALISALAYSFFETLFQTLFPDALGLNYYYWPNLAQGLDLSGASLLSFLIWLTNEFVFILLKDKKINFKLTFLLTFLYVGLFIYGHIKLEKFSNLEKKSALVKALLIQPNLNHRERDTARTGNEFVVEKVLNTHYEMTLKGLKEYPDANFIVWPETMYPFYYQSAYDLYQEEKENEINNFLNDKNITLFFGAFGKTGEPVVIKNNMYGITHFNRNTNIQRWEKTILFPFGEYIPMVQYFPFLKSIFKKANTPTPSENPSIWPVQGLNIGGSICYEILFSKLFLWQVDKEVDLVINISNESFFGTFGEPELNLLHAASRAIESRVPVLKDGNIGYTAGIKASGEIINLLETDKKGIVYTELPNVSYKHMGKSLYTKYGDWFYWFSLIFLTVYLCYSFFKKE